jgi:hypothetical protein
MLISAILWKWEFLSIFCSLFWFIYSIVYSFLCRGLLHALLNSSLGIFWGYVKWNCFPIFFSACTLFVYRKAAYFCELILYPASLLKMFMVHRSFLVSLFSIRSRHLKTGIAWLLPFLFVFLLFLLPIWLFCLRILRLCWARVERVDTLVSFLTLREWFQFFPF